MSDIRDKLSPKDKSIFKLVTWSLLIVWMLFWLAFSIIMGQAAGLKLALFLEDTTWAGVIKWVLPIWSIFTSLLTIILIARFAAKKL